MTVFGIARVKDEADIIGPVVEHMLTQVDHILVADNASTDGTREILRELPIEVIDDNEVGYWQEKKTTALAQYARKAGHSWVLPCDADESQLHACSVHPLQFASSLESPPRTDHLGEACHVRIATATG